MRRKQHIVCRDYAACSDKRYDEIKIFDNIFLIRIKQNKIKLSFYSSQHVKSNTTLYHYQLVNAGLPEIIPCALYLQWILFYCYDFTFFAHSICKPECRKPCRCAYFQYSFTLDSLEEYREEHAGVSSYCKHFLAGRNSCLAVPFND